MDKISYRVLISAEAIQERITELAEVLNTEYRGCDLVLLCNLKGAFIFLADLCRRLDVPHEIDFIATASYHGGTKSSGKVRIVKDLKSDIEDRHVLIVEDIVDTGTTLDYVRRYLELHKPASVRTVTLLDKKECRVIAIDPDWVGFTIPDKFVLGYGLDFAEKYRDLDFIAEYTGTLAE